MSYIKDEKYDRILLFGVPREKDMVPGADAKGGHGRACCPPLRLLVGKSECLSENFRILHKSHPNDWLMIVFLAFHKIEYFMLH